MVGGQGADAVLARTVTWESLQRQIRAAATADRERATGGAATGQLATSGAATDDEDPTAWLPPGWVPGSSDPWDTHAPAHHPDGTPVPPSVLARLAYSEISRIVFGPDSDVLDVGRAQRVFTGQQRRAVLARDEHCQFPGCTAPPTLCEVHHVRWWERDHGPTSVDNGILICWHHHDVIHQRTLTITRRLGRWEFTRHDGSPLADARTHSSRVHRGTVSRRRAASRCLGAAAGRWRRESGGRRAGS